ncbi:amino acid adenylation domain-containing protein [Streptomyces sp. NPDC048751]|uniref:non-ribosomal peptide synthetase n=1 Tax=Streptomyces sp. NPDC048751 TaxID=3365591 RepID=UPI003720F1D5
MGTSVEAGREFWRDVLTAGGSTALPRWTLDPVSGIAEHEALLPEDLVAAVSRLSDDAAPPLRSVLLAAHAKVLAALSGEREVTTGYVAERGGRPLPCRLTTEPDSWRTLVLRTHRAESETLVHKDFPVDRLRRELGLPAPSTEAVFDPTGGGGELPGDAVLRLELPRRGGRRFLRLRYRTDALDADCAARIVGYHLTALRLIAADPDAAHGRQSLLSAEEYRFQIDGLAGRRRELPGHRCHELFEQRVRVHPEAVAALRGDQRWTYRELNARANRLGRSLLARNLRREGVVAVVTERNLDWAAAVLAVLKAGGVYLPVEPHFPAERIATMLSRAGCDLVLTEPGSTATLDEALDALPAVRTVSVDEAYAEGHPDSDLGVDVTPDQLAYIYFTSGSTGEPKGAMCEHAGLLNHLHAKIDDLGIGEGQVVAQTAPQCFDISLWQLLSALLVGGRTLLVEQNAVLDVPRFVDTIADGEVRVLQVVPSYLDAVVACLERHPRELPHLRCVSVTGEALKKELAERWFASGAKIRLVNAYGLTETSDDTNHEIMDRAPERDRVPLGPPVNNVRVYVVDERLAPVPLGAPGELVFSGVCVGRGYVNDPERTRLAFTTDPHRPGERLYRSGDHGRWLPEGKLEFLGRRDTQVKIRGFRIEIGEVENAMLRVPGVRDGAVVAVRGGRLVAFCSGGRPPRDGLLKDRLGESLPAYMIPSEFHWRESLPVTANGKVDRKALTALAERLAAVAPDPGPGGTESDGADKDRAERDVPRTPTERRLAAVWAQVLDIPERGIRRNDHFFDRGGTSLAAVRLAISLDRAVDITDVTRHPVLADLARTVERHAPARGGAGGAEHPRTAASLPNGNRKESPMPSSIPLSLPAVDLRPGKPPILRADSAGDTAGWAAEHRDALRAVVAEHGSVLVRGLGLRDRAETAVVFRQLADGLMTEKEAFASRRTYSDGVYSSSKWPPNQPMCMHHELSYTLEFPGLLLFACLAAPDAGGATALADAPTVLNALPTELVERFLREGWLLTRNFNDEIGASFADAFGTEDRGAVESYCHAAAIAFEWQPDGGLRTWQRRSAVVHHPVTGRSCWFNQIAFLNEWTLDPEIREYLVDVYGADGLPFNTRYGDGAPIGEDTVRLLNDVYQSHTVREAWQTGDLMLVDNIRTAHSREPYDGAREVLVAMTDPRLLADCSPTVEVTLA